MKAVSSRCDGVSEAPIIIPEGASFKDMVGLKGRRDIGDQINRKVIEPLATANHLPGMPDFNDATRLGRGREMVKRLTSLIVIFEDCELDPGPNCVDSDNFLIDCWEYLIGRFAADCQQGKGQFYTPPEVSSLMAKLIGIGQVRTGGATTVYDPTCGSASLLLKVADQATADVTLYGQERDWATVALARMNMILHKKRSSVIEQGNSLANHIAPLRGNEFMTFDYVVAHPPFGDRSWSRGIDAISDPPQRFKEFAAPPARRGDFAYLLHVVLSLNGTGKGACILPQGILFRGSSEADIRRNLVDKGYIKGIVGLPPNLFYGTGIPACIVVIDKLEAHNRKAIFVVDASAGFVKAGRKNRLREIDVRRIADALNSQLVIPGYSRMIGRSEIEKNEFNLNISRYVQSEAA